MASQKSPSPSLLERHSSLVVTASLSLVVLMSAGIRLRLLNVPLERDEGEYAYAGQLIRRGFPPYLHAYNMKFPGVYAAYAVLMSAFGETIAGIRIGLLIVNVATIVLVFLLARRLMEPLPAVAAAASFAFLSLGMSVLGSYAHATHFVILFVVAASLTLLKGVETARSGWLIASGALFGLGVLMKQHGLFFIVFAAVYVIWDEYSIRHGSLRDSMAKIVKLSLGAAIPLGLTILLLWREGVLGKFWFWTFKYATNYVTEQPLSVGLHFLLNNFRAIVGASVVLWVLAGVGAIAMWSSSQARETRIFLIGLLSASILAIVPGFYFRPHYFILLLPSAALLIGSALGWLKNFLMTERLPVASISLPLFLLIVGLGSAALQQRVFLFEVRPEEASRMVYGAAAFPESVDVAAYIKAHTEESDRIAVLGSEPQIYFYSNRLSASGHIYMYGLMEPHSYAEQMQREMIDEVEQAAPKFVVQVFAPGSWVARPNSPEFVFQWMKGFVKEKYTLVGVAEIVSSDKTRYHWDKEAAEYSRRSRDVTDPYREFPTVLVFRRKGTAGGVASG